MRKLVVLALLLAVPSADAALQKTVVLQKAPSALVRIRPRSFVTGSAFNQTPAVILGAPEAAYRYGHIGGSFAGCGWIFDGILQPHSGGTPSNDFSCGHHTVKHSNAWIMSALGKGGSVTPKTPYGTDGRPATFDKKRKGCADRSAYANVSPWLVPAQPHDALGVVKHGSGLLWRYVTKDGAWVMVRDRHVGRHVVQRTGTPVPNWYFVSRACIKLR